MPITTKQRAPELLSPAGDWDSLRAAAANGAEAVYFGLTDFNARHRAANFTPEELPEVMQFLHHRNVRGYVTFNTLIFSGELAQAARLIETIARAGVDAVIVQDLGLMRLIRRLCPKLPIHASTQVTLTEPRGVEFVRALGAERVILARELSLDEIGEIAQQTTMPLEVFVHGALCVAYSGQCLTSEALGGRSANRGQCAQACRLPYELIVDGQPRDLGDKAYLLSPKDLAAYDLIEPLARLGVSCVKIEGRLKSAHYVAATTQTYRAALDAAAEGRPYSLSHGGLVSLEQSFSRGLTHGFLSGVNHQELVHARFPKSRGVRVGVVCGKTSLGLIVAVDPQHPLDLLKPGDGVVFDQGHPEQDEQGGRVHLVVPLAAGASSRSPGVSRGAPSANGREVEIRFAVGDVQLAGIELGSIVWRTDDPQLRRRLEQSFARDRAVRRLPLQFVLSGALGGPLRLVARCEGASAEAEWAGPLAVAQKHPTTAEVVREQLARLGETPFEIADLAVHVPPEAMIPKSVLNELRREVTGRLVTQRAEAGSRTVRTGAVGELREEALRIHPPADQRPDEPRLYVLARNLEQLQAVLRWRGEAGIQRPAMVYCDFEDVRRYGEATPLAREAGLPVGLATIRVLKPHEMGLLSHLAKANPDAILVRNLAGLTYFRQEHPQLPLAADFSLNIANELTAAILAETGVVRMVPSYDLNVAQLLDLLGRFDPSWWEVVVHQHIPMFHMEHCVFAHVLSSGTTFRDCGRPCDHHRVELRDRVGAPFPLVADTGCRNTVFNATAQSAAEFIPRLAQRGVRGFRVELLRERPDEVGLLLDQYARVLSGKDDGKDVWRRLKALSQLGVTRGTLEHD